MRRTILACLFAIASAVGRYADAGNDWDAEFQQGVRARALGNISASVDTLTQALVSAPDQGTRVRAMTQLGMSLMQAGHLADAERMLQQARALSAPGARQAITLALGNVALAKHERQRAIDLYQEVLASEDSGTGDDVRVLARLNLVRLQPPREKLNSLQDLYVQIQGVRNPTYRARAFISLGEQAIDSMETARLLAAYESGPDTGTPEQRALRISYQSLTSAAELAQRSGDGQLRIEALDGMAQLYQDQGRDDDALRLVHGALKLADAMLPGQVGLLRARLEFRSGRLNRRLGNDTEALAAYMRASRYLQAIRQDLPIDDESGQSTYASLVRPVFDNLLDLMLKDVDAMAGDAQQARLTSVLDALELTHQAEMQDYLGDRCSVDALRQRIATPLESGVAVLYTIALRDRVEVVVRQRDGLFHYAVPLAVTALDDDVNSLRSELSDPSSSAYPEAQHLYQLLIAPLEARPSMANVRELVVVPDGALRLVPFGALYDGRQFIVERYVVSTVTGLTMTEGGGKLTGHTRSLLAGLATPGPVIDKLLSMNFSGIAGASNGPAATESSLRSQLELPGVTEEIRHIGTPGASVSLVDGGFTVARFEREVGTGDYRVIHVASHSVFGDSAQQSFLLAYDDVIRLNDLQKLIADHEVGQGTAIELLTLSACDTAKDDDRAPLGFAGAAIKARARSVVGSLWAVEDRAEQQLMQVFYANLAQHGKAEALALAQRSMIRSQQFSHPSSWAPVVLIGDWD